MYIMNITALILYYLPPGLQFEKLNFELGPAFLSHTLPQISL